MTSINKETKSSLHEDILASISIFYLQYPSLLFSWCRETLPAHPNIPDRRHPLLRRPGPLPALQLLSSSTFAHLSTLNSPRSTHVQVSSSPPLRFSTTSSAARVLSSSRRRFLTTSRRLDFSRLINSSQTPCLRRVARRRTRAAPSPLPPPLLLPPRLRRLLKAQRTSCMSKNKQKSSGRGRVLPLACHISRTAG